MIRVGACRVVTAAAAAAAIKSQPFLQIQRF